MRKMKEKDSDLFSILQDQNYMKYFLALSDKEAIPDKLLPESIQKKLKLASIHNQGRVSYLLLTIFLFSSTHFLPILDTLGSNNRNSTNLTT